MKHRGGLTRRAMLAGAGGLAAAGPGVAAAANGQPAGGDVPHAFEKPFPITGKAGPGLEPFDEAMTTIMDRHGVPGAGLAITRAGKLVLAKGYGWANTTTGEPIKPDTLFGLASLSKSI